MSNDNPIDPELISIDTPSEAEDWIKLDGSNYPLHNVGVLVFIPDEDFHITSGMWDIDNKWVLLDEYRVPECEVTHYMPLPKAPVEYQKQIQEHYEIMKQLSNHITKK